MAMAGQFTAAQDTRRHPGLSQHTTTPPPKARLGPPVAYLPDTSSRASQAVVYLIGTLLALGVNLFFANADRLEPFRRARGPCKSSAKSTRRAREQEHSSSREPVTVQGLDCGVSGPARFIGRDASISSEGLAVIFFFKPSNNFLLSAILHAQNLVTGRDMHSPGSVFLHLAIQRLLVTRHTLPAQDLVTGWHSLHWQQLPVTGRTHHAPNLMTEEG
ncbi:hypothetical protein EDB89DRAFT_1904872 [Lactarius sanguifluus]|nr:hypothetical protein EDB89DRAFT_1904872 [Lactarius sanguifluus]